MWSSLTATPDRSVCASVHVRVCACLCVLCVFVRQGSGVCVACVYASRDRR